MSRVQKKKRNSPLKKQKKKQKHHTPAIAVKMLAISETRRKAEVYTAHRMVLSTLGNRLQIVRQSSSGGISDPGTVPPLFAERPGSSWTSCLLRPEGKLTPAHQMLS